MLLVDDHPVFLRGLRAVLEEERWVASILEADTAADAVRIAREHPVTVVAMDVALPDADGIEATRRILEIRPTVNVLMLTMLDDDEIVFRALHAGAHGYARKDIQPDKLVQALSTVADGGVVLGPSIGAGVLAGVRRTTAVLPPPFDRLNDRDRLLLYRMALGDNNAQIAHRLGLAEKTIRNQISELFDKLGARDRVRAVLLVHDSGVLPYLTPDTAR
ncbi:response regulator transcription factor [Actinoplanes aureus]|uniref:response regulator transcription factor n=1 Tax=Actinoplanes aureus TaxID=2792083 RepID=UPI002815D77D|nr:response regulator transcription factor [Actinoplanes aureus]